MCTSSCVQGMSSKMVHTCFHTSCVPSLTHRTVITIVYIQTVKGSRLTGKLGFQASALGLLKHGQHRPNTMKFTLSLKIQSAKIIDIENQAM